MTKVILGNLLLGNLMPENRKLRVFLCHASQDKPIVRELYQRLKSEEWIEPWLDEEELLPGQDWDIEIERAVEAADAVIVFLSSYSVSKEGYVQKEIRFALNMALFKPSETIFIVPLRLDNCLVPRNLNTIQYIDFFPSKRFEWAYQRLNRSLEMRLQQIIEAENISSNSTVHDQEVSQIQDGIILPAKKRSRKKNNIPQTAKKRRPKKISEKVSSDDDFQEKINPEHAMNLLSLAQSNLKRGYLRSALENYNALAQKGAYLGILVVTLEELVKAHPDNSLAWETLGYVYKGLNQDDKSKRAFNKA